MSESLAVNQTWLVALTQEINAIDEQVHGLSFVRTWLVNYLNNPTSNNVVVGPMTTNEPASSVHPTGFQESFPFRKMS